MGIRSWRRVQRIDPKGKESVSVDHAKTPHAFEPDGPRGGVTARLDPLRCVPFSLPRPDRRLFDGGHGKNEMLPDPKVPQPLM